MAGQFAEREGDALERRVVTMAGALAHRGPDRGDVWLHGTKPVAFGHRRLAIIDLSADGAQPMHRGPLTITYNGELYNYRELQSELIAAGVCFRSKSDTEVLLAAIEVWGIERALERAVGMFAFALWDDRDDTLWLARDRFGEKPLYVWRQGGGLAFASELKALESLPGFGSAVDRAALDSFLRTGCLPGGTSIYRDVAQVPPGSAMGFRRGDFSGAPRTLQYWSIEAAIAQARATPFTGSPEEAADELERVLLAAVGRQAVADVPLGCFLSGGIDSSTVTALLQRVSDRPVRTFTIGSDSESDETDEAAAVAAHLGTDHTSLKVSGRDALEIVPRLATMYDEPFGDSSQIPTFLVSQLARRDVTVALSGDGGDEVFGGYRRHVSAARRWQQITNVPLPMRQIVSGAVRRVRPGVFDALERPLRSTGRWKLKGGLGNHVHKGARAFGAESSAALIEALTTQWSPAIQLVEGSAPSRFTRADDPLLSVAENMMRLDTANYLVDDILTKVDRAAMANSLETRVPFLDPSVFAFAWSLPQHLKIGPRNGKLVVRDVLAKYVPRPLFERPKSGFAVPLGSWLRGPLEGWANAMLQPARLREAGLVSEPITCAWDDHVAGRRNVEHALWNVLMFLAWLEVHPCS